MPELADDYGSPMSHVAHLEQITTLQRQISQKTRDVGCRQSPARD